MAIFTTFFCSFQSFALFSVFGNMVPYFQSNMGSSSNRYLFKSSILVLLLTVLSRATVGKSTSSHPKWTLLDHTKCGRIMEDRIIGGKKAALGQFPWMARIGLAQLRDRKNVAFECGGALIHPSYVLTAAHCSYDVKMVRLGENYPRSVRDCEGQRCAPPVQDIPPEKIFRHEKYDNDGESMSAYDIALIRLTKPAELNDFVGTLCLPPPEMLSKNYIGKKTLVAGWGINNQTENRYTVAQELLYVRLPVIPSERCFESYFTKLLDSQLCAGGQEGYDSCGGDSGGPLIKTESFGEAGPRYYQLGIVSYGNKWCGLVYPAVYTDVRSFVDWILDKIEA